MEFLDEVITFSVKNKGNFTLVEFELKRELEPKDLANIKPPDPIRNGFSSNVVILSGRGPIWLYGYLIHFYHPTRAIAVFDPRLMGAVVVESHFKEFKAGDLIKMEEFL